MDLSKILSPSAIRPMLKVQSKKRLFQEMAEISAEALDLHASDVCRAIQEREDLGPTGVGHGVAIPHARLDMVNRVLGMFFRLETPIEFEAVDHKPVDLVFLLLAPKNASADHLKALARVSRTFRNEDTCAKLRSTNDASAIYAILTEAKASKAA